MDFLVEDFAVKTRKQYWCYKVIELPHFFSFTVDMTVFFLLSRFFFTDSDDSQDSRGREENIFYSSLPLPPAHELSGIYLELCVWGGYHVFLISPLVFTRLLLDGIYYLIELPFWLIDNRMVISVCLLDDYLLGFF